MQMKFDNPELSIPLNSAELDELDLVLKTIESSISDLHGYFCAIISAPTFIMPSQWQAAVFDDIEFESNEQAIRAMGLVMRFYNQTSTQLQNGDFKPILYKGADSNSRVLDLKVTADWVMGYLDGMDLDPVWSEFNEEGGSMGLFLLPLIAGCAGLSEDVPASEELIQGMIGILEDTARHFYENWKEITKGSSNNLMEFNQVYTSTKTQGRNEPCACGSGKKYKKCCLNAGVSLDPLLYN